MPRLVVIGLDCVPPRFAFDLFADVMPNLGRLRARGRHGPMRSCVPPITLPAWSAMFSGRDPGELGVYGFQRPMPGSYRRTLCGPSDLMEPRLWHLAAAAGKRVAVLFVPPSFPPEPLPGGVQVSGFLTPGDDLPFAEPQALATELRARFGRIRFDVEDFRTDDPTPVLAEVQALTAQHFGIAQHVLETRRPDLLAMVDIGPDRFHHAFFQHVEPRHPQFRSDNPFVNAGRQYYAALDRHLGELVEAVERQGDATIMVVSDHGARPLLGGICLNEWLLQRGDLVLRSPPTKVVPLSEADVDWSRTRVYAEGGYCGRLRVNLAGREPEGIVTPRQAPDVIAALAEAVSAIPGPEGQPLNHRIVPATAYRKRRGAPPDLQVFLGDLDYRAIASVGHGRLHLPGNDRGPDGCNHDWDGIFVAAGAGVTPDPRPLQDCQIYDVATTGLSLLGLPVPDGLLGRDQSRSQPA